MLTCGCDARRLGGARRAEESARSEPAASRCGARVDLRPGGDTSLRSGPPPRWAGRGATEGAGDGAAGGRPQGGRRGGDRGDRRYGPKRAVHRPRAGGGHRRRGHRERGDGDPRMRPSNWDELRLRGLRDRRSRRPSVLVDLDLARRRRRLFVGDVLGDDRDVVDRVRLAWLRRGSERHRRRGGCGRDDSRGRERSLEKRRRRRRGRGDHRGRHRGSRMVRRARRSERGLGSRRDRGAAARRRGADPRRRRPDPRPAGWYGVQLSSGEE